MTLHHMKGCYTMHGSLETAFALEASEIGTAQASGYGRWATGRVTLFGDSA